MTVFIHTRLRAISFLRFDEKQFITFSPEDSEESQSPEGGNLRVILLILLSTYNVFSFYFFFDPKHALHSAPLIVSVHIIFTSLSIA